MCIHCCIPALMQLRKEHQSDVLIRQQSAIIFSGGFSRKIDTSTVVRWRTGGRGMRAILLVLALSLMGVGAQAQVYQGSNAVTLSVANEFEAHLIAAQFCARGDKYSIVRVHGRRGDEIAINCLAGPAAAPTAGTQPAQPAAKPTPQLLAPFQRALSTLSAAAQAEGPAAEETLFARFKRALTALSVPGQPEIPPSEKDPLARPEHDGTVTPSTYAQGW
jgi:hypothetical protein